MTLCELCEALKKAKLRERRRKRGEDWNGDGLEGGRGWVGGINFQDIKSHLIQNENARLPQESSSHTKQLPLPGAEIAATF